MRVLTLNAGSSSIKYQLFDSDKVVASGLLERIGETSGLSDHRAGLDEIVQRLREAGLWDGLEAIGHRVVHGGEKFVAPTLIDAEVIEEIRKLTPLAPLHNPANVIGIEVARDLCPDVPQVAVFDTAFHQSIPARAYRYAVPESLYRDHGVRRYGFHGTSHAYVARRAAEILGSHDVNLITLHLGNGASAAAIQSGVCIDTSMGMSPLEGLVMGTRSGDIDPAIVFHLVRETGGSVDEVDELLNRSSGLKGLCGENDLREVERRADAGDQAAQVALDVYCYRIKKYIGAYAAALGRVDAVVFTAGVGENQATVRARACAGLDAFGIEIDDSRNAENAEVISAAGSSVSVLVIPTDEEYEIARETEECLVGS